MHTKYALAGSSVLLAVLIIGVSLAAYALTPMRGGPSTSTVVVHTSSSNNLNETNLILSLKLPNGTSFTSGTAFVGSYASSVVNGSYLFSNITPGTYSLNYTGAPNIFIPPFTMKLSKGVNFVNETIYPLRFFVLVETSGLSYNGTQPGPSLSVRNNTAVRIEIFNNTTQINNFAVVLNLANVSQTNVLFNSLSNNLSPGGSTNDTFIVSRTGPFYYTSLIGSQSKDGENGRFLVTP
jgi:hypothetical protein